MNQKRKRLGLWILFLAALLLTQFTVPVKASEPQIQDVNIQMVGGQIRTIDPMGAANGCLHQEIIYSRVGKKRSDGKLWNRTASEKVFDRRSGIDA